jgi:hypothetical protein
MIALTFVLYFVKHGLYKIKIYVFKVRDAYLDELCVLQSRPT